MPTFTFLPEHKFKKRSAAAKKELKSQESLQEIKSEKKPVLSDRLIFLSQPKFKSKLKASTKKKVKFSKSPVRSRK